MNRQYHPHQQGATLAISLILLFLATIVGVSTIRSTLLEEKMSDNAQDKSRAFEAAESALIAGENYILGLTEEPIPSASCSVYPCVQNLYDSLFLEEKDNTWWAANSASYSTSLSEVNSAPRYTVEFVRFVADTPVIGKGTPSGSFYYRVTAKGTGASDNARAVLQTTVGRRY